MKQTPIQKMLEFTQIQIDAIKSIENDADFPNAPAVLRFLKRQREVLQSLLPYERECIEGAYDAGCNSIDIHENAQDYFTNTYNNPQGGGGE